MENSSEKSQEELEANDEYEGVSNKSTAGTDDDDELIFVDSTNRHCQTVEEKARFLLKRPSIAKHEKKLRKLDREEERNSFVERWVSEQSNENVEDSDEEEFETQDSHHRHDEIMEEIARQKKKLPRGSEQIFSCEENNKKEDFVKSWVSDVVKSSLNDMESEDANLSLKSFSSNASEIGSLIATTQKNDERKKLSDTVSSHRKLYSTSSFSRNAASFLQKNGTMQSGTQRCKPNEGTLKHKKETSEYARFARATGVQGKCPRSKSQDQGIVRTRSRSINFIARNKSMASSYGNRVFEQKKRRRPKTSVDKKEIDTGFDTKVTRSRDPFSPAKPKEKVADSTTTEAELDVKVAEDSIPISPAKLREDMKGRVLNLASMERKRLLSAQWSVLSDKQLISFQKLFSRFDQSKSGGISAKELHSAMKELMPNENVPFEDLKRVHAELDIKQTGEIEFDEFMFAMTNPKNYLKLLQDDDKEKLIKYVRLWEEFQSEQPNRKSVCFRAYAKKDSTASNKEPSKSRGNIFFSMVRTATKKDSMKEIRHFYANKIKRMSDHVIHDWSAGQRCIGLSDKGVIKRYSLIMKELQERKISFANEKAYQDSPYAKPLLWRLAELKRDSSAKRHSLPTDRIPKILQHSIISTADKKQARYNTTQNRTTPGVSFAEDSQELKTTWTKKNHIGGGTSKIWKRPVRKVAEIEQDFTDRRPHLEATVRKDVFRAYAVPGSEVKFSELLGKKEAKRRPGRGGPTRRIKFSEFVVTPKMVPLPEFPTDKFPRKFDYDHLGELRKQAALILQEYYRKLKKVSAKNSKDIYKKLQVDQIPSPVLQHHFRKSYLAYSGDNEPFVVSPWIPFPFISPWVRSTSAEKSVAKTAWM